MRRISSIIMGIAMTVMGAGDATAQWNVARFGNEGTRVYTTFGLDPAIVTSVGLADAGRLMGHPFQLNADVGVVSAKVDAGDYRARLGLQTSLLRWKDVNLAGSATFITRGTDNSVYRGFNFGAEFSGTGTIFLFWWARKRMT